MNSADIKFAAALLQKRTQIQTLKSTLVVKPSLRLQLCAVTADEDGTMHDDFTVSNELGQGLLAIALQANTEALRNIGVTEFQDAMSPPPSTESGVAE